MKKHFLMFLAVAATFSMSACSNDDQENAVATPDQGNTVVTPNQENITVNPEGYTVTFTAGMDSGATSKTTIAGESGRELWFTKDDNILIVDAKGQTADVTITLPENAETSSTCTLTATFGNPPEGPYKAYYINYCNIFDEGLFQGVIPLYQHPAEGSFDPDAHVMTAPATDDYNFVFTTKNSFFKFTAPCDLAEVSIYATNGEDVLGDYQESNDGTLNFSGGSPNVIINSPLKAGKTYYISVMPNTFVAGSLKLALTSTSNVVKTYTVDKEFTAVANKVYTFSKIADIFVEKIKCADLETFLNSDDYYDGVSICLEDYNGNSFNNNPIRDENKKVTIILPNELTSIGARAFSRCNSLTEVVIPEGVQSIGDDAFYECYNLKSINIPSSVTTLGGRVFSGCKSLATLTIDVETIPSRFFYNMGSLTYVVLGDNVKTICSNAFEGCSGIKSMTIGKSVTTVESGALKYIEGEIHVTPTLKSKIEREYYGYTLIADVPEN